MSRVEVHADRVIVQLTAREKSLAWRRRDVVLDRRLITSAIITADPWVWLRGVRVLGTQFPGRLAYGVWRNLTGRDFALINRRRAAVVIDLDVPEDAETDARWVSEFDPYARLILSTSHATDLVTALRLETTEDDEVFTTNTEA